MAVMLDSIPPEGAARRVRAALMNKVCGEGEMFALGASIARVVDMASSDDHGTHELAYYVVSDPALTERILRLSNTIRYRTLGGAPVTTISRAISLLGFDNVKATALTMLLVDALDSSGHAASVRMELEAALCASLVGREMARYSFFQGAEEAAICALFKNLGPLLVASHEHDRYREIGALVAAGKHTVGQASQMILGCSYDTLSQAVLAEWKLPDMIVRAQAPLARSIPEVAANRGEWMRQVAAFGHEVACLLAKTYEPVGSPEALALLARYGKALDLDRVRMGELMGAVQEGMRCLLECMNIQPAPKSSVQDSGAGLPDVLMLATLDAGEEEQVGAHPSGKPRNARDLLLAGVQDVTQMRVSGGKVNDVILAVLETLYSALGFRFATVCLKDVKSGQYRARAVLGRDSAHKQADFAFSAASHRDLFHLSMENGADLIISDASSPKIRDLLPEWHRKLLPDARSFIVLPLVVGQVQLGLFYGDRALAAPEGVPPDEAALIKALKAQVLAVLGS